MSIRYPVLVRQMPQDCHAAADPGNPVQRMRRRQSPPQRRGKISGSTGGRASSEPWPRQRPFCARRSLAAMSCRHGNPGSGGASPPRPPGFVAAPLYKWQSRVVPPVPLAVFGAPIGVPPAVLPARPSRAPYSRLPSHSTADDAPAPCILRTRPENTHLTAASSIASSGGSSKH